MKHLGALALALLLAAAGAPALRADNASTPPMLRDVGIDQRLGQKLPLDAIFQDETGRAVRLAQYFGARPVVLVLAYYNCPMLCSQVLAGLLSAARVLSFDAGKEYEIVVVSFDPRDRPADARAKKEPFVAEYKRPGAADGWHFLTGSLASIERVTRAVGFRYRYDEDQGQFAHASAIYVATAEGVLSRYFYGIEYAPRDLRLALVEASQGKIGTPVDQILLYCYHYDPKAGKYSAAVMNIVRLGGVLAVLILTAFLTVMWRRDRRRDRIRDAALVRPEASGTPARAGAASADSRTV
jgi:protein SCO1/2